MDDVPIHTAQVVVSETANCSFELLPHSTNSPDLVPSDFFLFSKLKSHLLGHHFRNNNKAISAVKEFLEDQDATFFYDGIAILKYQ